MVGIVEFGSLRDAQAAGFEVCGEDANGYLVRIRTARGWAMALARRTREERA